MLLVSEVKKSLQLGFFSIATIYINPTQFNSKNDYINYPRKTKQDISKLKKIKCDAIYFPKQKEVYPSVVKSTRKINIYRDILCDKFRPGHFDGVTTVVESLFNLVKPDHAFFGEKDFQQIKIIEALNKQFNKKINIDACKSIRMKNGISFSSRFENLKSNDHKILNKCALEIKKLISKLKNKISQSEIRNFQFILKKIGIKKIEYIEILDEKNLKAANSIYNSRLFLAFYIGNVRIIDNFVLY